MIGENLSPKAKRFLFVSLLICIVIGFSFFAYSRLEWEEKEIDLGYSKEARQNNFLAAEIFLRKHGVQATSIKNLTLLDEHRWRNIELGAEDTLVLINANKTLTSERYDSLYEWVENGGTLITSTRNPFIGVHTDEEDLLLSDFGITPAEEGDVEQKPDFLKNLADEFDETADEEPQNKKEEKEETGKDPEQNNENNNKKSGMTKNKNSKKNDDEPERPENYYRCSLSDAPTEISFADEEKPLLFDFTHEDPFIYHHEDENSEDESNEDGNTGIFNDEGNSQSNTTSTVTTEEAHLMYFEVGSGSITVTSDNNIWSNRRIDCHDHAYALWGLVNPNGRVWFLTNQDAPSLTAILWQHAKYAVLASMLALLCWLWLKSSRFGPVFTTETQGRRSLAEHIHASAMLLWRKQQHPQLIKLLREELLARLDQQHPQISGTANSKSERIQLLQQLTGLKESEIRLALYADDLHHPQVFSNAIAHLQMIRKQL